MRRIVFVLIVIVGFAVAVSTTARGSGISGEAPTVLTATPTPTGTVEPETSMPTPAETAPPITPTAVVDDGYDAAKRENPPPPGWLSDFEDRSTKISVTVIEQGTNKPIAGARIDIEELGIHAVSGADGTFFAKDLGLAVRGAPDDPEPTLVSVTTSADGYAPDIVKNYSLFPNSSTWLLTVELSSKTQVRDFRGLPRAYWKPRGVEPSSAPVTILPEP
jgi:hypothetical protein